jgi:hypothetical protein
MPHAGDPSPGHSSIPAINFLSTALLFYGAILGNYTAVAATAAISAAWAAVSFRGENARYRRVAGGIVAAAIAAFLSCLILVSFMVRLLFGYQANLGFEIPILLGAAVIPTLLATSLPSPFRRWLVRGILIFALMVTTAAFGPSLVHRCRQAVKLTFSLARKKLRANLSADNPELLWRCYVQLVRVEEAFRTLKGDLGLRPIYHHKPERIQAHLFVAFLAYCLSITLRQRLKALAGGLMPRVIFEKLATLQLLDVRVPTTDGRELLLVRRTESDRDVVLLLSRLNLQLPSEPPPRIRPPKAT